MRDIRVPNCLQIRDLTSVWNVSANSSEPAHGYELLPVISLLSNMRTVTVTEHARITYCADGTYKEPGLSSMGNWSKNGTPELTDGFLNAVGIRDNFTVKWVIERLIRQ